MSNRKLPPRGKGNAYLDIRVFFPLDGWQGEASGKPRGNFIFPVGWNALEVEAILSPFRLSDWFH
jgi:hypothetical protein